MRLSKNIQRCLSVAGLLLAASGMSVASTFTFQNVSATGTYLQTFNDSGATGPLFLTIGSGALTGFTAGNTINLTAVGSMCFSGGNSNPAGCTQLGVGAIATPPIIAMFTTSTFVDVPSTLNRLSGTLLTSLGVNAVSTVCTNFGCVATDVPNDFGITAAGVNVVIPNGALYLVLATYDSYYTDNLDRSPVDWGVNIAQAAPVPEPATYGMLLSGLGGILAFRRFRRK
jgi:PEP-CTERM motif-containing protein